MSNYIRTKREEGIGCFWGRLRVHSPERCAGEVCCIHNPSDHAMRSWPQVFRLDRGIMERKCAHGVGHPDPDDLRIRTGQDRGDHGCCGCCSIAIANQALAGGNQLSEAERAVTTSASEAP